MVENPSFVLIYRLVVRTGILIRLAATSCTSFEANAQNRTDYSEFHLLFDKSFIFIRNILIALLVLICSRFQVGIKTLSGQADRAPARSVTSEDCPSDCIGARGLQVYLDHQARTTPTNRFIFVSSKDRTPLPYHHVILSATTPNLPIRFEIRQRFKPLAICLYSPWGTQSNTSLDLLLSCTTFSST